MEQAMNKDPSLVPETASMSKADDFAFAQEDARLTDLKFDTKPIGYFKDAWIRFRKSHAAVVGAIIILLIVAFACIMPAVSPHSVNEAGDTYYSLKVPYNEPLSHIGIANGTYTKRCNIKAYLNISGIGMAYEDTDGVSLDPKKGIASTFNPVRSASDAYTASGSTYRDCSINAYYEVGFQFIDGITEEEYNNIKAFETEYNVQVIYPMVDTSDEDSVLSRNANYWYKTDAGYPVDSDGNRITTLTGMANAQNIYLKDGSGNVMFYRSMASSQRMIRVFYWNYYRYQNNGAIPNFLFGTDDLGRDISVRLASGIGLSLLLGVSTFAVNFVIGSIYGAIEGYYGGLTDLIMERVSDILADIPFIVLASIVNINLISPGKMSSFGAIVFAFVLTGWLGPAYRMRTQFYRFKNQEYVLAARTLGASDARIMWKHIFPNTLGTIITASVLTIPGTIFTESMLSYLNIINLNSGNVTSLGTLLSTGQAYMTTYPHIIVPPCIIISLLMISFNLFGNGLRDAFNPSLRGVEE
jgi:oligopeptide transport system permease protein